jgi:uncharacterized protein (DUF2461 family)
MPDPEMLAAIRARVAERHEELRKILRAKGLRNLLGDLQGEQLTRTPKGFATDHPAADLLRFKRFILYVTLPPDLATTPELYGEVVRRFRAMMPFMNFLGSAVPAKKPVTPYLTEL